MIQKLTFTQFVKQYPNDQTCMEEIRKVRYRDGMYCQFCERVTDHYKLKHRNAYSCEFCRHQVYPLAGTIFEKTTTPLRLWFYAMFLMTHTKGGISIKQLERELGVTYKTAWRMYKNIHMLMALNNGDLLSGTVEIDEPYVGEKQNSRIYRWTLFNKFEIKVVQREEKSG
jgi:transposase